MSLFHLLGVEQPTKKKIEELSLRINIPAGKLNYYHKNGLLPDLSDLEKIESVLRISRFSLMVGLGVYNNELVDFFKNHLDQLNPLFPNLEGGRAANNMALEQPGFRTEHGRLYQKDCIALMEKLEDETVDLVFADPPFNLNKFYLSEINDSLSEQDYLIWCEKWLDQSIRILKEGGSLFIWNIPKWNTYIANYLSQRLTFKHWISTDIKYSLPIQGKLYPSHYSLLYFTKGEKANTFHPNKLPMEVCRSCHKEIKDYGGYKDKMNPKGINLPDVWYDIPPVRHKKYKAREEANELSIKLLDRIIEMSTNPGDLVFDPFGGSGTTYIVAEMKHRKWLGTEIGPINRIIERFDKIEDEINYLDAIRKDYNSLFTPEVKKQRSKKGIWTDETFKDRENQLLLHGDDRLKNTEAISTGH